MSTSITTRKGSIAGKYIKRTAGIISGATGEYFKEAMPVTSSTISEAGATIAQGTQTLANTARSVFPKMRQLRSQVSFKQLNNWFLRKEGEFEDPSSDFDIPFDTDVEDDRASITEMEIDGWDRNANRVSKAVVESSHQMVESQLIATANIASTLDKQTAVISAGFDTTNKTLNKILEVLTKNTATLIETTVAKNEETDANAEMIASGKFNFSDYKKIVKSNFANSPLAMASIIPSLLTMGKDMATPELIFGELFKAGINKAAPKLKGNLGALDEAVNSALMTSLIRLGENRDFNEKGILSRLFGLDASRKDTDTSRSSLQLKSISWDTMSKEALTDVVPGYLRQMLIQMGGPDLVYDYKARRFKKSSAIEKSFRDATTAGGTFWSAKDKIQEGLSAGNIGFSQSTQMLYDLMMQDLGSTYANGKEKRNQLSRMANNKKETAEYIKRLTDSMNFTEADIKDQETFIENLARVLGDEQLRADISTQAASTEIMRQQRGKAFVSQAQMYNMDLSHLRDSPEANRRHIAAMYGKNVADDPDSSIGEEKVTALQGTSGVDYSNKALYEIYHRLDEGLNVFVVGRNRSQKDKFPLMDALKPPKFYKPKGISNKPPVAEAGGATLDPGKYGDEPNLLENQTDEDGNTENLSGGERAARWGKRRGKQLIGALFNGSPEDIKQIFSASIADVSSIAGDKMKEGIRKVDSAFGNVSGYLKHKMFGTEYTYETGEVDEKGNPITKTIAKNDGEGIFGFVKKEVQGMFGAAKEKAGDWFKDVAGYFDYGEEDEDKDDPEGKIQKKRRKLLASSVGAFAGAGILGGPIGLLVGGIAGNALSTMGIGSKLKNFLFGVNKDGEPTGLLSKAADKIISPIEYQVGKTVSFAGAMLKKNVFGPLSDLGYAVKDRINNKIDSIFDGAKKWFGDKLKSAGKAVATGLSKAAVGLATVSNRLGITGAGKAARAGIGAVTGIFSAGVNAATAKYSKNAFHKLKDGETYKLYVGEKYFDTTEEADNKGQNWKCVHELEDDNPEVRDFKDGSRGVLLVGGNPPAWYPLTKDYIKRRRKARNAAIDDELKSNGYNSNGGIRGFFGGNYKEWHKQKYAKRAGKMRELEDAMAEHEKEVTDEEEEAPVSEETKALVEGTQTIAEVTSSIDKRLENEIIPGSSFKTHDQGLWDRVDIIIEALTGKKPDFNSQQTSDEETGDETDSDSENPEESTESEGGATIADEQNGAIPAITSNESTDEKSEESAAEISDKHEDQEPVKSNGGIKEKEPDPVGLTLLQSGATLADEGGLDDKDEKNVQRMARSVSNGESRQSILNRFSTIMKENKDKADAAALHEEEKSESFLSKLFGGLGNVLLNNWPIILGGLTLLSDKFRNWLLNDVLPSAGAWLSENLPDILSGIWNGATDINREVHNSATGAETKQDEVTGEKAGLLSAEQIASDKQTGELRRSFEVATSPQVLIKDGLIRTVMSKGISGIATATGLTSTIVSGGAKVLNGIVRAGQSAPIFMEGVKQHGAKIGFTWAKDWFGMAEGSKTLSAISNASSKVTDVADAVKGTASAKGAMATKGAGAKFANLAGFGTNMVVSTGSNVINTALWEFMDRKKRGNWVGDYGFGRAGGARDTNTTLQTITTNTTAAIAGQVSGMAVSAALSGTGLFAAGAALASNPAGWVAAIIIGSVALAAALTALVNAISNAFKENQEKDYAVRSNATKMYSVINDAVEYKQGDINNAIYVYRANDSDRVLGLDSGFFIRNPEVYFGSYLAKIIEGLSTVPGCEVMLHDFIDNMAVQGVPFAVYVAGDSAEANADGKQANGTLASNTESTRTTGLVFKKEKVQVLQSVVKKHKDEILADIQANMSRQGCNYLFDWDDVKDIYKVGEKVKNFLSDKKIIKSNGKIDTSKFDKYSPSGDESNSNNGWDVLIAKVKSKDDIQFFLRCIAYINSKIEATSDEGKQWMAVKEKEITKCIELIRSNLGIDTATLSDENGDNSKDKKNPLNSAAEDTKNGASGKKATESATITPQTPQKKENKALSKNIPAGDQADVEKELHYLTASYMYAHPELLQKWVKKHKDESGITDTDHLYQIDKWDTVQDSYMQKSLLKDMATAADNFATINGDIFDLIPRFDWSDSSPLRNKYKNWPWEKAQDAIERFGSGFVFRGETVKPGKGALDKLWDGGKVYDESTPRDMHQTLMGSPDHGRAAEDPTDSSFTAYPTPEHYGIIGKIGSLMWAYDPKDPSAYDGPSSGGTMPSDSPYKNAINAINPNSPKDMPALGGPVPEEAIPGDTDGASTEPTGATIKNGGNPLNKPLNTPRNGQKYGMRQLDKGPEFHSGVDLTPADGSGSAQVGARFNGTVTKVKWDVPDSHTGLGVSSDQTGNYVEFKTDDGKTIKNYHMKYGSIPSKFRQVGARVSIGDKLGEMGSTGRSTGAHLHYQIESPEYPANPKGLHTVDPMTTINGNGADSTTQFTDDGSSLYASPDGSGTYPSSDTSGEGTGTSKKGLAGILEALTSFGKDILNKITGGLFGSSSSSSSDGTSEFSDGTYGNYDTSDTSGALTLSGSTVTSLAEFLAMCAAEIGTCEQPANSNNVKYNTWYYGHQVSGDYPWCMAFVQWCFNNAGLPLPHRTASCSNLLSWYRGSKGNLVHDIGQPGDIVIFNFGHTGIVESVNGDTYTCIEGNTSPDDKGSQSNGGCVARKKRNKSKITAFIQAVDFNQLQSLSSTISKTVGAGAEGIWKYLKGEGYSDAGAAGIMGNLEAESGLMSNNLQNSYNKKFGLTDEAYTAGVDNGSYSSFSSDSAGYGLAQWTYSSRKKKLLEAAKRAGRSIADPAVQLEYLNREIGEYGLASKLKNASSVKNASNVMLHEFEAPADQSASVENKRASMGQKYYDQFKGVGGPTAEISSDQRLSRINPDLLPDDGVPIEEVGGPSDSLISSIRTPNISRRATPAKRSSRTSALGGPTSIMNSGIEDEDSSYTLQPRSIPPVVSDSNSSTVTGVSSLDPAIEIMQRMLDALIMIRDNTGSSSDLLGALNEKDFVDKGVRDTLTALGKSSKKGATRHVPSGNNRQVANMARP